MKKKIIGGVLIACLLCILMRLLVSLQVDDTMPAQLDYVQVAKEASKIQGKLVVMRIYGTTTVYREITSKIKKIAQIGYVHDGSADIVVDLTKARFQVFGNTNLVIIVPTPKLDRSTVGIDPGKKIRVKSIPRSGWRSQKVFTALESECEKEIIQKQYETFSSLDVIEDAKIQARRVLSNFYQKCVDDKINVEVEFSGQYVPCSNPDVKLMKTGM